ncbi:putative tRNA threonylcarbamoyladenosine biosynthesis protein Gcp [Nitrospira sp. KM1]|uniref:tRNA (adenosine(37)-N6)-threonylcarbamoyltransferase complex transferase subunit TsaD n=1 Tax=Nitrospira sp. KM1 TaxID=1936990 RepID=UPI0013A75C1B|nr:tRNA (adenosine(37)-N6)-threonylcarbamoyltransferase complex transferase subunit TsaD [Nitrospira sp. KM1]BCA53528.1 putative tRNA threonylcarbamoyladenosine biosynthesis protein Gcp [Nitrospira sp. KM1]
MFSSDESKPVTGQIDTYLSADRWVEGPLLGIETSCDETAAAVLDADGTVRSSVISSQHQVHERFGGVVPELASRAHIESIETIAASALERAGTAWRDICGVAVTQGPGLAGALIVGVSYAKALAYALRIPLVGVTHLEGHIASAWLQNPDFPSSAVVLVVSGGHTHLYKKTKAGPCQLLGCTRDDAAGEAFDKGAQMLGLGFPGGPALDKLAQSGDSKKIPFPKSSIRKAALEFSFSGLKTALLYKLQRMTLASVDRDRAHLAAGFQESIVSVLVDKAFEAVRQTGIGALAVVGGVSANSRLRMLLHEKARSEGIQLSIPSLQYCTDNAAMIASAGMQALRAGRRASLDTEACASLDEASMR